MVKTPTSATSPDRQQVRAKAPVNTTQRGFTLIELLVVLAIGALLVGLVPAAFNKLQEGSQYRDTVRAMLTELKQARQQALAHGQPVVFSVNLTDRNFGIAGRPAKGIPESLEVKTTVGRSEAPDNTPHPAITFLPEGGSTGGTIELIRKSGTGVRLRVDWLFGQVTQEPNTP